MHAKLKNFKIKQILTAKACADRHVALSRAPPPPPVTAKEIEEKKIDIIRRRCFKQRVQSSR